MKVLKIIGSPIAVICTFLLVTISGEGFGGPYLMYILLGLPHGADYAITALMGLVSLIIAHKIYRRERRHWLKPALTLAGILLLFWSLHYFFTNDRLRYNYNTFLNTVPIITLVLFSLTVVCAIIVSIACLIGSIKRTGATMNSLHRA